MSELHPIVAVTGSSGAGTSTVRAAFEHMFHRLNANAVYIEGDAFHSLDRLEMQAALQKASIRGENFSHFGPAANHFGKLESLFKNYSDNGTGEFRRYLHTEDDAVPLGKVAGTFTEWESVQPDTDVMLYEGLHGGVQTERVNVSQYVDLLIGVVPTLNLEWIQKIHRDTGERGYSPEDVTATVLRRMHDYVHYITPQFSITDINFQRVPLVDTSNPFIARDVPSDDESLVVIRFRHPRKLKVDFPYVLTMIKDSFMTRPNTICVPGSRMRMAMEIILRPLLEEMLAKRRALLDAEKPVKKKKKPWNTAN